MVGGTHIYGGFNISPYLALKIFEAVNEITAKSVDLTLSHVDDDNCEICRGERAKEAERDAAGPDRAGHEWTA